MTELSSLTKEEFEQLLKQRIDMFIKHAESVQDKHWEDNSFSWPKPPFSLVFGSRWCKIVRDNAAYGFIALKTFSNKTVGNVKAGDIHRSASWKIPAKTARGSVFTDAFNDCATPYGIKYLN